MEDSGSDYIQVRLICGTRDKTARLSKGLDKSFSSYNSLKRLVYKHFPELEDSSSEKSGLSTGRNSVSGRDQTGDCKGLQMKVSWKDGDGHFVVLEGDKELKAIDLAQRSLVELRIETSGSLSPCPAISKYNPRSTTALNLRQMAGSSQRSKPQSCKYFQAGRCKNGDACTFSHIPADSPSWRREDHWLPSGVPDPGLERRRRTWFVPSCRRDSTIADDLSDSLIATLALPDAQSFEENFGREKLRKLVSPPLPEPTLRACCSQTADGSVFWDDRCLRRFRAGVLSESGADLNEGYESYVEKREDEATLANNFANLLACLRANAISLEDVHFVTFRNNVTKILGTAYNRRERWEMGVYKRSQTVYLDVRRLEEVPPNEVQQRAWQRGFYWGHAFEKLATEDPKGGTPRSNHDSPSHNASVQGSSSGTRAIDANEEFRAVFCTKMGDHKIIMAAVGDCYEEGEDGKKAYVELKTNRKNKEITVHNFRKVKLLKVWVQSFVTGVKRIACGLRDDNGMLVQTEMVSTTDITERAHMEHMWDGGVCLVFAEKVLNWIYKTVTANENDNFPGNFLLRFEPEQNRLELLRADACPESITKHVGELSGDL